MEGKDVLARAKTGSGKTGAYVLDSTFKYVRLINSTSFTRYAIPVVQKILEDKAKQSAVTAGSSSEGGSGCVRALVLVPSKELSQQAVGNIKVRAW